MQRTAIERPSGEPVADGVRPDWLPAAGLAALLVAYNNLIFALPGDLAFPDGWFLYPRAVLVPLLVVVWAIRSQRLSLRDLGITTRGLVRGSAMGLALAAAVALPAAFYFTFPIGVSHGSIDFDSSAHDSAGAFLLWALVQYPLTSAVFEEVLFRGVLLALAWRSFGIAGGALFSAVTFAGWHIAVDYTTMNDSNVADNAAFFAFAQAGALVALFVGGLALAALRRRDVSLAGPIVFHWLAVVAMNAALFAQAD